MEPELTFQVTNDTPVEPPVLATHESLLLNTLNSTISVLLQQNQQTQNTLADISRAMAQTTSVVIDLQTRNTTAVREPKLPDVFTYDGDPTTYASFWVSVQSFFQSQPITYRDDVVKINYVFSRLTGTAHEWLAAMKRSPNAADNIELRNFEIFENSFKAHFCNRNLDAEALDQLLTLKQGNTPLTKHLAKFESLRAAAVSLLPPGEVGLIYLFKSLKPEILKEVRNWSMLKPELSNNYNDVKQFLLQRDSNERLFLAHSATSSAHGPIPMDISMVNASSDAVNVGTGARWNKLPPKNWKLLKEGLINAKCCLSCRDFIESGHQPGSTCKFKTKNFDSAFGNKTTTEPYLLSSLSSSSFILPLYFNNSKVIALIDTGAQGTAYMSAKLSKALQLDLQTISPIQIRQFQGASVEQINSQTEKISFKLQTKIFSEKFFIVSKLVTDVILGFDFFVNNNLLIDCKKKLITQVEPVNSSDSSEMHLSSCRDDDLFFQTLQLSQDESFTLDSLNTVECEEILSGDEQQVLKFYSGMLHLNSFTQDALPFFLADFECVFNLDNLKHLPSYKEEMAMPIEMLPGVDIPQGFPYKLSAAEDAALVKTLEEGKASGIIDHSNSDGGAPVLFVKKPDSSLRMCVDYRKLNEATKSIQAILPNIDDILAALPSSSKPLYSKIDLTGAFHQLRIKQGDEAKTTFSTKYGKFLWKVIPFGFKNAPGFFQSTMNKFFGHLFGKGVFVYIDDILIAEPDPVLHRKLLFDVLQVLKDNQLTANLSKCFFEVDTVEFLGYLLSPAGIQMQDSKVKPLLEFPLPTSVKMLQRFLGLCNYYRKFIPHYSEIAASLFKLLKKSNTSFLWDEDANTAFSKLKQAFTADSFLILADRTKPFYLYTDCSKQALAGALHQRDDQDVERPVAFFSRTLTTSEQNYPIYDKELLAIKASLEHWRHLLVQTSSPVTIFCDHKNLLYFKKPHLLNERQSRWHEFLEDFNYSIQYLPGIKNVVADTLSRPSDHLSQLASHEVVMLPDPLFVQTLAPLSRNTFEYYTPPEIVNLAKLVAGVDKFDLDPASCAQANQLSQIAHKYYTLQNNGLCPDNKWEGHIFLNPPYTSAVGTSRQWVERVLNEYASGNIQSATLLLRDAEGSTFFNSLLDKSYVCFLKNRLTFWSPMGKCRHHARDKHVLCYLGPRGTNFKGLMSQYGFISTPLHSPSTQLSKSVSIATTGSEFVETVSENELFDLSFLREQLPDVTQEQIVLDDPSQTSADTWPVFYYYLLQNQPLPVSLPKKYKKLLQRDLKFMSLRDGKLYRKVTYTNNVYWVPYVVKSLRQGQIKGLHETLGHLSTASVLDSLRTRGWWPGQRAELQIFSRSCDQCQLHTPYVNTSSPLTPIPPTGIPFYRWGIDFVQDLPLTENGNTNIIVAVDHATRFVVASAVSDRTSKTVAKFLFTLMLQFGSPQEVISDRASAFMAETLQEFLNLQQINHLPSSPYHPQTNGMTERVNGVLGALVTKMSLGIRERWDEFVKPAVFILNARTHSTTGFSPFYLVYGVQPRLPGDIFPPIAHRHVTSSDQSLITNRQLTKLGQHRALALSRSHTNARNWQESNGYTSEPTFVIGQFVKLKNFTKLKFQYRWTGPYIIDQIGPHNTYYLRRSDGSLLPSPYSGTHLASWTSQDGGVLSETDTDSVRDHSDTNIDNQIQVNETLAIMTQLD
jgi:transposase InsO family protein